MSDALSRLASAKKWFTKSLPKKKINRRFEEAKHDLLPPHTRTERKSLASSTLNTHARAALPKKKNSGFKSVRASFEGKRKA